VNTVAREAASAAMAMQWSCTRFEGLSLQGLYDLLKLRARVFILEQDCPYLDLDGVDQQSSHLLGRNAQGELMLYLRVVDPGIKYEEPSLGRVVNDPKVRGSGLGRVLVGEGVQRCLAAWPGQGIRISAQAHLAKFYGEFGFEPVGETYLEDNIPHIEMLRRP